MNNIWTIFKNGLRHAKAILIMSVGLSVLVTVLFVMVIGVAEDDIAGMNIGIVDRDTSYISDDFKAYLQNDVEAGIVLSDDTGSLNTELIEKNISAIIEIPAGFEEGILAEKPVPLELTFLDDYANEAFVREYIDAYTSGIIALSLASGGDAQTLKALTKTAAEETPAVRTVAKDADKIRRDAEQSGVASMLGFYMMFAFLIAIGLTSMLFFDRKSGTYRRIKTTNATSVQYTAAMSLVGMVMALLIISLPMLYLGISDIDAGVPLHVILIMVLIFSVFVVASGMLIGLALPSFDSMIFVLIAAGQIMAMLGGAYFPIDTSPEIFRKIALITPQYWFFDVISSYQNGAGHWLLSFTIIALMALLCFVLTAIRFASSKSAGRPLAA
jgi:ABC-2 type transport system permease protein